MSLYKSFKTDADREKTGVWHEVGDGVSILVARWGNAKHVEAERLARKPYQSILRSGRDLPDEIAVKTNIEAMAKAVLLDWKGVTDAADQPLPYSVQAAVKVLTDLPDFRHMVAGMAQEATAYRSDQVEDDLGNSSAV